jgi:TolA-binding protein
MLLGSVTALSNKENMAGFYGVGMGTDTATATIHARVVDVETADVLLSFSENGSAKNSGFAFAIKGFSIAEVELGGLEARAIADAVGRMGHKVRAELAGDYSYVVSDRGSEILIDAGSNLGVQPGNIYLAYADGRSVLGIDGKLLGYEKIPLAVLKVDKSEIGFSSCVLAAPSKKGIILRGDKIEPISPEEAKKLADAKKLPKTRPPGASKTHLTEELLFGGRPPAAAPVPEPADAEPAYYEPPADETGSGAVDSGDASAEPAAGQAKMTLAAQTPAQQRQQADAPERAGFDPNQSSDSKVINTYPISQRDRNTLGIAQRGAYSLYAKRRYKDALEAFAKLADDYPSCNYLSAYWAGMTALKMRGKRDEAKEWFDRALAINPNYQPAIDQKEKLEKPSGKKAKK